MLVYFLTPQMRMLSLCLCRPHEPSCSGSRRSSSHIRADKAFMAGLRASWAALDSALLFQLVTDDAIHQRHSQSRCMLSEVHLICRCCWKIDGILWVCAIKPVMGQFVRTEAGSSGPGPSVWQARHLTCMWHACDMQPYGLPLQITMSTLVLGIGSIGSHTLS